MGGWARRGGDWEFLSFMSLSLKICSFFSHFPIHYKVTKGSEYPGFKIVKPQTERREKQPETTPRKER